MAQDYLPEGFAIGQMRAEYRKSALLHDCIVPEVFEQEDTLKAVSYTHLLRPQLFGCFAGYAYFAKRGYFRAKG